MKKIILIRILLLAFIALPLGCGRDPLDITPDGRISLDDVFKDERQVEAYRYPLSHKNLLFLINQLI